jgi:hypothetical protein
MVLFERAIGHPFVVFVLLSRKGGGVSVFERGRLFGKKIAGQKYWVMDLSEQRPELHDMVDGFGFLQEIAEPVLRLRMPWVLFIWYSTEGGCLAACWAGFLHIANSQLLASVFDLRSPISVYSMIRTRKKP